MSTDMSPRLELENIQNGAIRPRPYPYVGVYVLLRIDDRRAGREVLRRLLPALSTSTDPTDPSKQAWICAGFTFQGLKAVGVPEDSLESFPLAFREGMAARAKSLGDVAESAPERWEPPLGSPDVHMAISVLSPDSERLDTLLARARAAYHELAGIEVVFRQDVYMRPDAREPFGFRDDISQPAIEGLGIPGTNRREEPFKAGEFVLGYPNELGEVTRVPQPEILGRNGTYIAFSKLHQRVAAFRQYVRANASTAADEALIAAKIVGRWPSGAPLVLTPQNDDPELGHDSQRSNDFLYEAEDPRGLRCPLGAHARRMNPRDASIIGVSRLHRIIRRSTTYGPELPEGVMEDDGADRGIIFIAVGASLERQFEFLKTEWINQGTFFGSPDEKDPLVGPNDGSGTFTVPQQPVRRRLKSLPAFVINRGGEYCFIPSLSAIRWLAALDA
ncbi:MAG TPA: Dyp-type peroxidase [Candidatus Cybelea sp.]